MNKVDTLEDCGIVPEGTNDGFDIGSWYDDVVGRLPPELTKEAAKQGKKIVQSAGEATGNAITKKIENYVEKKADPDALKNVLLPGGNEYGQASNSNDSNEKGIIDQVKPYLTHPATVGAALGGTLYLAKVTGPLTSLLLGVVGMGATYLLHHKDEAKSTIENTVQKIKNTVKES